MATEQKEKSSSTPATFPTLETAPFSSLEMRFGEGFSALFLVLADGRYVRLGDCNTTGLPGPVTVTREELLRVIAKGAK